MYLLPTCTSAKGCGCFPSFVVLVQAWEALVSTLAASQRSSCIMQPSWVTHWMMPFPMGGRHQRKVSLAGNTVVTMDPHT